MNDKLEELIKKTLSRRVKKRIMDEGYRKAAILFILYNRGNGYFTLLTRRSSNLPYHPAQISFPGGAYDPGDNSLIETAIREVYEEIGLRIAPSQILGELDDIKTLTSRFIISPFLAFINYPFVLDINKNEIEEIIELPLSFIMNRNNLKRGKWMINDKEEESIYYVYADHLIWGATARILKNFVDMLEEIPPSSLFSWI